MLSRSSFRLVAVMCAFVLSVFPATRVGAYFTEDFEQRYFLEENGLVTDHCLVRVPGDGFHLFYTIGISGQGWMFPDNMIDFGHASSADLVHWTIHPRVLSVQAGTWKERNLFAPQVVAMPPNGYVMYYTGLDSAVVQATGVAISDDLFDWVDLSVDEPAYHPDPAWAEWSPGVWSDGRDPFAWKLDGGVMLLTTATASSTYTGSTRLGALSFAQSYDGINFEDVGFPFFLNNTAAVLESASLFRRPNGYFLFYHEAGMPGVRYMTSPSLFSGWNKTNAKVLDPYTFGPADVVYTGEATLFSRVIDADLSGAPIFGAKIDTIKFTSTTAYYGAQNRLWDGWYVVEGDAFDLQPTFGDRPRARGGAPTGMQGYFVINTAERYDGPLGIENSGNPPVYEATGILRSEPFVVSGDHMNLSVGGGNDPDSLYVALVDAATEQILVRSTGGDSDRLFLRHWDLTPYQGLEVFVEISDLRQDEPLGYIAVDDLREGPGAGVGIPDQEPAAPAFGARLGAPFPNPVLSDTRIPLALEGDARVRLAVYDVQGRMRRLLRDALLTAGSYELTWDGRDARGRALESGVYFLRLDAAGRATTHKVVIGR